MNWVSAFFYLNAKCRFTVKLGFELASAIIPVLPTNRSAIATTFTHVIFQGDISAVDCLHSLQALAYVFDRLVRLMAPFMPFITDYMWHNLARLQNENTPACVHHMAMPKAELVFYSFKFLHFFSFRLFYIFSRQPACTYGNAPMPKL